MPYNQGMNSLNTSLVTLAEIFASRKGVSLWRVGHLAANRGSFFVDLKSGKRHCQTDTYERVLQWFTNNWAADAEWPTDIPRPPVTPPEPKEAPAGDEAAPAGADGQVEEPVA